MTFSQLDEGRIQSFKRGTQGWSKAGEREHQGEVRKSCNEDVDKQEKQTKGGNGKHTWGWIKKGANRDLMGGTKNKYELHQLRWKIFLWLICLIYWFFKFHYLG